MCGARVKRMMIDQLMRNPHKEGNLGKALCQNEPAPCRRQTHNNNKRTQNQRICTIRGVCVCAVNVTIYSMDDELSRDNCFFIRLFVCLFSRRGGE